MHYEIEEYLETLNEDYELIRNEYSGTEHYNEIIHCLDWIFPNWNTNLGLGYGAPEFLMSVIYHTQEVFESEDQLQGLEAVYDEILHAYATSEKFYFEQFKEKCDWFVMHMSEDEFLDFYGKEEDACSKADLDEAYKMYLNSQIGLEPFNFEF